MATPLIAPVSTSAAFAAARMVEAKAADDVVSSFVPVKLTVVDVIVGASLTLLTAILAEAEFELNAVVPPRVEASALLAVLSVLAVPLV
jgi:hypothetical protein